MVVSQGAAQIGDMRIFMCVTFLFRPERLRYLFETIASAAEWGAQDVSCVIFTEAAEEDRLTTLTRLLAKLQRSSFRIAISSHPDVAKRPRHLPWQHKMAMRNAYENLPEAYTHYLYIEDDLRLTRSNLQYFLDFSENLTPYGLLPGFVRYEFNVREGDIFTTDQQGRQRLSGKTMVRIDGRDFISLDVPYAGMFIVERHMMPQYLESPAADRIESRSLVEWGTPERAAMGLTWTDVPADFPSRMVVPLKPGTTMPDPMCWVHHLPDNYTNDYADTPNFILGKTRMDDIFEDADAIGDERRYISCAEALSQDCPGIELIRELYPSRHYGRPEPLLHAEPDFADAVRRLYQQIDQENPASLLVHLKHAFLLGSVIYLGEGHGLTMLYETYRPNDRGYVTAPLPREIRQMFWIDIPNEADTIHLYVGSAGVGNYGHWLVDDLPRMEAAFALREAYPNRHIRILMDSANEHLDTIKVQSIIRYVRGLTNISLQYLHPFRLYRSRTLFYASPVSNHPLTKSPDALDTLYRRITADLPQDGPRLLFVSRRAPYSRTLLNHDDVERELAAAGFQTCVIDTQSFDEQVSLFANADVIVGCMGAAMTNLAFARPGAKVIFLAPDGWIEPFFWDLAALRGLRYAALYGATEKNDLPPHLRSYWIGIEPLMALLERITEN
ncbi:hypothetical protein AA101099_2107 [Neoasaia chiangmaiensis NBRC 101099]|uniref:Uncharacterized protein n=2 Tax=Neoasaia chiangmaiensis TaxID=320497 RepID=A0A1U9KSU4_9PROT|nr:hypothetical protein A0U93_14390 [Neoasaia chiangmaiensis]GBR40426.1 hypothetical protein AA101099_2107 [Neoasaia chiangmaiensis NBRC 101099]GEN13905.1 hypothetical protein NCH01_03360 [Neoasaia chiangmaiensis]